MWEAEVKQPLARRPEPRVDSSPEPALDGSHRASGPAALDVTEAAHGPVSWLCQLLAVSAAGWGSRPSLVSRGPLEASVPEDSGCRQAQRGPRSQASVGPAGDSW